ncbi:MAG: hypothetical protein OEV21_04720 [Thermoplasmata archaeon]|nr:hypothetical protein [Thermoplasmata archaeon]
MMPETSMNTDASVKYWDDVWLDQLIEEAIRLAKKEKGVIAQNSE